MAYTATNWANNVPPPLSAANLNKLTNELKAQATTYGVSHTLPTWVDGAAPALTTAAPFNEMERVTAQIALLRSSSYAVTAWQDGWTPSRNATRLNKLEQQVATNSVPVAGTSDYYVSQLGNDTTGNGSSSSPWRTIKKACDTVTSGVIGVAGGTYIESGTLNVKDGVSIQGAGKASTIIKGATAFTPLMLVQNTSTAAKLSGFKLDGQAKAMGNTGLLVSNVSNLTVSTIEASDFRGGGTPDGTGRMGSAAFRGVTNCDVGFSTFRNGGGIYDDTTGAFGTLGIGDANGCTFHDLTVYDATYLAIKGLGGNTITNVTFYNIDAQCGNPVIHTGAPFNAVWANCSLEMFSSRPTNVVIRNCYFNSNMSLTGGDVWAPLPVGQNSFEIHHNYFDLPYEVEMPQYGVEPLHHSVEVHHNYFHGGANMAVIAGPQQMTRNRWHHNVMDDQLADFYYIMRLDSGDIGTFTNNTFLARRGDTPGMFYSRAGDAPVMTDNIFSSTAPFSQNRFGNPATTNVNRNVFYNIGGTAGSNAVSASAQPLAVSGGFPTAYVPTSAYSAYGAFAQGQFTVGIQ